MVIEQYFYCIIRVKNNIDKKLREARTQAQKDEIIDAIKNSSIIHWSHINFFGTYDFTKIDKKVSAMIS